MAVCALWNEQAGWGHQPRLSGALRSQNITPAGNFRRLGSNVWRIMRKHLRVQGYRLQLLQTLNLQDHNPNLQDHNPNLQDHNLCFQFHVAFRQRLEEDGFAEKLPFSDKTFHARGKVGHHSTYIRGTEHPHAVLEHIRYLPKVSVLCLLLPLPSQPPVVSTTWTCCNCG
jgi:hypothetical protein